MSKGEGREVVPTATIGGSQAVAITSVAPEVMVVAVVTITGGVGAPRGSTTPPGIWTGGGAGAVAV